MSFGVIAAGVAIAGAVGSTYMSIQGAKANATAQKNQIYAEREASRQRAEAQQLAAKWNADQAEGQAIREEEVAQENMRRKKDNNRRAIARDRAKGARGGLKETGAVADMLVDKSERLADEVDDIWDEAIVKTNVLRGQASMSLWEGKQAIDADKARQQGFVNQLSSVKSKSKYAVYGAIAKGVGGVASGGVSMHKALKAKQ